MAAAKRSKGKKSTGVDYPLPTVDIDLPFQVDPQLIQEFPEEVAREFGVIPLGKADENTLILGSSGRLSKRKLANLKERLDGYFLVLPSPAAEFQTLFKRLFDQNDATSDGERDERVELTDHAEDTREEIEEVLPASDENLPVTVEKFDGNGSAEIPAPKDLSEVLIDLGLLSQSDLEKLRRDGESQDRPDLDLSPFIEAEILRLVPDGLAQRCSILPLAQVDGDLVLATSRTLTEEETAQITGITGLNPKPIMAGAAELQPSINGCYRLNNESGPQEMRLGEFLLNNGYISQGQLEECLQEHTSSGEQLGVVLIRRGFVTEDIVYGYLSKKLGCEYRQFSTSDIDVELSKMVSKKFSERNLVLPLALDQENQVLKVAMAEPYDLKVMDTLKSLVGDRDLQLRPVLSSPENIKEGIEYTYSFRDLFDDELELEILPAESEPDRKDLVASEDLPKIRRIINQVLYRAVVEGASDVHIENLQNRVRVRFRLDGLLQERKTSIAKDNIRSVCSVFKVDSGLDITENRRSQDGVFKMRIGSEHFVDFRINLHSTDFGQDAVIRLLDTSKNLLDLDSVGFPPAALQRYFSLIENPQGLILFNGPTGSGKSTTLYSTLAHLNSGEKKIVTAEDPVEYYLDGICQYKVNESIGNTFAEYGRRFMRKDPDIILIGEIRDEETAESCLKAATTGHLVFSTLHTNDSVGAVQRLQHLGVDSSTVGEALLAVLSQRLTRRSCSKCTEPYEPDPAMLEIFFAEGPPDDWVFYRGAGCAACDYLGYRGRLGLYEYWELKPEVVLAIVSDEKDVRRVARQSGLMHLVEDGLRKVKQGTTTLEELRRVVPLEQIRSYVRYHGRREGPMI